MAGINQKTNPLGRLVVISHTGHYKNNRGEVMGWTSTVRELDYLAQFFDEIVHVAVLKEENSIPKSVSAYKAKNIRFVSIPFFGGPGFSGKWSIIKYLPKIIQTSLREVRKGDYFQFRAPTSIGVFLIPILTIFSRKKGWFKYAGNWVQANKPLSYRIQKWLLNFSQQRPVTINGQWPGQKRHVFSFENPCLDQKDFITGQKVRSKKRYDQALTACFVGRLSEAKGVDRIIASLEALKAKGINKIHFVGDGDRKVLYEKQAQIQGIQCEFHGFLSREKTFAIYSESHLILLPSNSEGFPKVIAEGANFGCVPIVSAVSAIPQYVGDHNGYLWNVHTSFEEYMSAIKLSANQLSYKAENLEELAIKFTYHHYWQKLKGKVFNHE